MHDCETWMAEASAALKALDRALDAGQPGEEYWEGYERRLRARMASVSRKRAARRVWALAAVVAASIVIAVIGFHRPPRGVPSSETASVSASPPPVEAAIPAATPPAARDPSLALTFDLGRHLDSVRLLLVSVKNGADDIELDRRQARRLLDSHRVLRQAATEAGDVAAGAILDRIEPYLLDIKHLPEDSPEEARWLQAQLRNNPILTLVSGDETNP